MWPVFLLLTVLDGAGLYLLANSYMADKVRAEQLRAAQLRAAAVPPKLQTPTPPPMIHPPAIATMLQSGTLIVISKKSQSMFVFSDGALWASGPISTGKRRHETPSGVFPILQKRKFHRSNIYSGAPMPFMQRLTWDGIALHAGRVPGYPASHGCVRIPRALAQSLFKLTTMTATTVVIGDAPLTTDIEAQQFALTANLPIRSALAPPADPSHIGRLAVQLARAVAPQSGPVPIVLAASAAPPAPTPALAAPTNTAQANAPKASAAQTIQLAAAASPSEAEEHWLRLLSKRPDLARFAKTVEAATVKSRRVYRLRISGADAHGYCLKLKSAGISCLTVI
jgi:hypothetical protein